MREKTPAQQATITNDRGTPKTARPRVRPSPLALPDEDVDDDDEDHSEAKRPHSQATPIVAPTTRVYEDAEVTQYLDPFPLPPESTFSLPPVLYDASHECCATVPEYGVHRGTTFSSK